MIPASWYVTPWVVCDTNCISRSNGVLLLRLDHQNCGSHLGHWVHSCSLSSRIIHSSGSQQPRLEDSNSPVKAPTWNGKELRLLVQQPIRKSDLPTALSELRSGSFSPRWALRQLQPQPTIQATRWETLNQDHPAKLLPDSWPYRIINACRFKLLCLGIICYTEIDN